MVIQEGTELIQDCKTMCLFFTDGQITFITWDHRMIPGPFVKVPSLQEGPVIVNNNPNPVIVAKDQLEVASDVPQKVTHTWLITIHTGKVPHRFSMDGLERYRGSPLALGWTEK